MASALKAVILAGGQSLSRCPLAMVRPRPLFPLPAGALLEHLLGILCDIHVDEAIVCANGHTRVLREYVRTSRYADARLEYHDDALPRGPGGCLRDVADFVGDGTFLVFEAGVYLEGDITALLEEHWLRGSALTLAAVPAHEWAAGDGIASTDAPLSPLGVYVAEPEVLEHIPDRGYFDIKEQLLPRLSAKHIAADHVRYCGQHRRVASPSCYAGLVREILGGSIGRRQLASLREVAPQVWAEEGARLDPTALLIGPVAIATNATVGRKAVLTGPTLICEDVVIGDGAVVSNAILWPGASVGAGATVEHAILTDSFRVQDGASVRHCVAVDRELGLGDLRGLRLGGFRVNPLSSIPVNGRASHSVLPRLAALWQAIKSMRRRPPDSNSSDTTQSGSRHTGR